MRTTFTALQTKCKNITQNPASTDSTLTAFLKDEINIAGRFIYAELQEYMTTKSDTRSTVANTQYYQLPPDFMNMDTVTATIGAVKYTLDIINSQRQWDRLNAVVFSGTTIPKHFFVRRDDVGIWPIPQSVYTLTYNYTYRMRDMTQEDYTTGTITLTNASSVVTGSGTTFTAPMVGRWLIPTVDQYDYKLDTFTSTTVMSIQDVFRGTTGSSLGYTIGETPELPPELHELIPYRVASNFFSGFRKDLEQATFWNNMFWTGDPQNDSRDILRAVGGLLGAKKRYARRSATRVVRKRASYDTLSDRVWMTTISDS